MFSVVPSRKICRATSFAFVLSLLSIFALYTKQITAVIKAVVKATIPFLVYVGAFPIVSVFLNETNIIIALSTALSVLVFSRFAKKYAVSQIEDSLEAIDDRKFAKKLEATSVMNMILVYIIVAVIFSAFGKSVLTGNIFGALLIPILVCLVPACAIAFHFLAVFRYVNTRAPSMFWERAREVKLSHASAFLKNVTPSLIGDEKLPKEDFVQGYLVLLTIIFMAIFISFIVYYIYFDYYLFTHGLKTALEKTFIAVCLLFYILLMFLCFYHDEKSVIKMLEKRYESIFKKLGDGETVKLEGLDLKTLKKESILNPIDLKLFELLVKAKAMNFFGIFSEPFTEKAKQEEKGKRKEQEANEEISGKFLSKNMEYYTGGRDDKDEE